MPLLHPRVSFRNARGEVPKRFVKNAQAEGVWLVYAA